VIEHGEQSAMEMKTRGCVGVCVLLAVTAFIAACDQKAPPATSQAVAPPAQASRTEDVAAIQSMLQPPNPPAASPVGGQALPPGHPPMPGAQPSAPPGMPAGHPPTGGSAAGTLKYEPPGDWKPVKPSGSMRKAQYAMPRAESDSEDGELVVFYFGKNEGGGTRDNIERWKSQFTRADGKPLEGDAGKTEEFEVNGLKITLLDVSGRYAPGMMPGAPTIDPKDDFRMFAAVIETPGGPWFFKATGPGATMEAQSAAFRKLLEGMTYEP
jgi:hypothetical protein